MSWVGAYLLTYLNNISEKWVSTMKAGLIFVNYRHDNLTSRGFVTI